MNGYARMGSLANKYAWIAMMHYGKAKEKAEKILTAEYYSDELSILKRQFENDVLIGVNFSAMALEAFFNDYAAYKLGDAFYYDNFEMLRPVAKFQIIMKFIFHQDMTKGEYLYQLIDKLFKLRNGYVHNKSKDAHGKGMREDDIAMTLLLSSRLVGLCDNHELELVRGVQREYHVPESMDCREM